MASSGRQPKKDIVAKQERIREEIEKIYQSAVTHKVQAVTLKTVLFLGSSRAGKSTIKAVLVDPTKVSEKITLFAQTQNPTFDSYTIDDNSKVLEIIDTPGLFEQRDKNSEKSQRDNESIFKLIAECLNREITRIHIVCFVIQFNNRLHTEDIQAMNQLIEFLGEDIARNTCLIVTHSESKGSDACEDFLRQLREHQEFNEGYFAQGIHFSGALNRDHWNSASSALLDEFETVCEYRNNLIELFSRDIEPFHLTQSTISALQNKMKENDELREQFNTSIKERDRFIVAMDHLKEECQKEINRLQQDLDTRELEFDEEIDRLKTANEQLTQEQTRQFNEQIQCLQEKHTEDAQRFVQQLQRLNDEKHQLTDKNQKLTDENQHLAGDKQQLTGQVQQLEADKQKLASQVQQLGADKQQLTNQVQQLEADKQKLASQVQQIEADKQRLTNQVQQLEADKQRLTGQVQQLEADKQRLTGQVQQLGADKQQLTYQVKQLEADKQKLAGQVQQIEIDKQRLTDRLDQINGDKQRLTGRVEQLEADKQRLAYQVQQLKADKQRLEYQVQQLARENGELKKPKGWFG